MATTVDFKIKKRDAHNWVVLRKVGAPIADRGPKKGQRIEAYWDESNPVGYYGHLKTAAKVLMDLLIEHELPGGEWSGQDLSDAINRAEQRCVRMIEEALGVRKKRRRREINL